MKTRPYLPLLLILLTAAVVYAAPMNFGTHRGPMNGDEPPVTLQKILAATIAREGAPAWNSGIVTAGTTPAIIPARDYRRAISVRNYDPSIQVGIGPDAATASGAGAYILLPGESVPIESAAAVYVYAATGSPVVRYTETYTPPPPSPTPAPTP